MKEILIYIVFFISFIISFYYLITSSYNFYKDYNNPYFYITVSSLFLISMLSYSFILYESEGFENLISVILITIVSIFIFRFPLNPLIFFSFPFLFRYFLNDTISFFISPFILFFILLLLSTNISLQNYLLSKYFSPFIDLYIKEANYSVRANYQSIIQLEENYILEGYNYAINIVLNQTGNYYLYYNLYNERENLINYINKEAKENEELYVNQTLNLLIGKIDNFINENKRILVLSLISIGVLLYSIFLSFTKFILNILRNKV